MLNAYLVLVVVAMLCELLAAIGWPGEKPVSLGWLGLFFYMLAQLVRA